jgi:GH43 family beta-xylosidase
MKAIITTFLFIIAAAMPQSAAADDFPAGHFTNPIGEGADPWVVRDPNAPRYLWCFSEGNRAIAIHTSDSPASLGRKHIVWRAPDDGPTSKEVWAPELHWLDQRWHLYFAPSDGQNRNHRTYVLRSRTTDPLGEYDLHGPLATGEGPDGRSPNLWAIDMTPLEHQGKRYAIWSGWDGPETDRQFLYIAPMKSPYELAGPRVLLSPNDEYPWEFTEGGGRGRGLHEGPQVLRNGDRTFLIYSTGASWLPTYQLGMMELIGDDPLDPAAWKKHPEPLFQSTEATFGVGHGSFVPSPDGTQWWHVYHAKLDREPGWRRGIYVQPMGFRPDGIPDFGQPVAAGVPLPLPAGSPPAGGLVLPFHAPLRSASSPDGWSYYGHHQFTRPSPDGLHLGEAPQAPINQFRSGEKWLLDALPPADLVASVTIDFRGDGQARDAGLMFRTSGPALGYDAQRGYFAGLIPRTGLLVLGRTDGNHWTEIGRVGVAIDAGQPQQLEVTCIGSEIIVRHQGVEVLRATDESHRHGLAGLRVVDCHAVFTDFRLRPVAGKD